MSSNNETIEARVQEIIHEPVEEMKKDGGSCDKNSYLHDKPAKVFYHVEDFIHPNDDAWIVIRNEVEMLKCKVHDKIYRMCI